MTTALTWDILYGDGVVIGAAQNGIHARGTRSAHAAKPRTKHREPSPVLFVARILSEGKIDFSRAIPYINGVDFNANRVNAGYYTVSNKVTNTNSLKVGGAVAGLAILLDAVNRSVYNEYIDVVVQESNGEQRALILLGSSSATEAYNRLSNSSGSMFTDQYGSPYSQALVSHNAQLIHEELTGERAPWYMFYDIQYSVDSQHKDGYQYYLWFDSSTQTAMALPIYYPGDSVLVGQRGFMGLNLYDAVSIPLNPSSFAVPEYNYLFGGEEAR